MKTTPERNAELYRRIQAGDTTAIERMIEANIGLVVMLADKFLQRNSSYEYLRDDLIAEGNLALVDRANYFSRPHDLVADVRKYLTTAITRSFRSLADSDGSISTPGRTQRRARTDCRESISPARTDVDLDTLSGDSSDRRLDLRDQLEACCEDSTDRQIMQRREAGDSDVEIAERLDVTDRTVRSRRRAIKRRYDEKSLALAV